jgi:predicted dehydrogenase
MIAANSKIGVAVVGLGIGEQHALSYVANQYCELRWLFDLEREKACALANSLGVGQVATDFEEILSDPETQVVSIASYDDAHFGQVVAALAANKHVFVEKPICRTIEELRAIKQLWASHGGRLRLSSNLVLRAAPLYKWLKSRLRAGDFGEIYSVDADYLYGRLHKITDGWRKDVEAYSVMAGGGVHLIDLLLWMTNQRPARVFATGNRICSQGTAFRYLDYVTVTFEYTSSLVARINANFGCVHPHQHVMRIYGTKETFFYDDAGPRCHVSRDRSMPAQPIELASKPATKGDLIPDFVDAIINDVDLSSDTQTHFDVISVVGACDKSLATGSVTEVEYI